MPLIAEATETAVANEALAHLGSTPILSVESGTDFKSKTCRAHFPVVRDALLRRYPWNFAEARGSWAASSTVPAFGFSRAFPFVNDPWCLKIRELPDASKDDKWRVVGRAIYCDLAAPLNVIFTRRVLEVALWDAQFRVAMGYALASVLARPVAKDIDLQKDMEEAARAACEEAFPTDASEGNDDDEPPMQDIIAARC